MGCCATVPQASVGVVQKFGRFAYIRQPGCVCLNPCGESVAGLVSLRVQQLDVRCETKTRDNVFVTVVVSIQYQVLPDKVFEAFYKLANPHQQITAYVFDVVRASVPRIPLDDVFEAKDHIAHSIKEKLHESMEEFGFEIVQALVTDIEPDPNVKRSMNEINSAQRMRIAALEKAEAEKILVVKNAEAQAEGKYLAGVGIARQRKAIIDGLRESVTEFTRATEANTKDVMDLVLITQYFDTLKDIGAHGKSNTIFIPHSPAAVGNTASELRSAFMEASAAKTKHPKAMRMDPD